MVLKTADLVMAWFVQQGALGVICLLLLMALSIVWGRWQKEVNGKFKRFEEEFLAVVKASQATNQEIATTQRQMGQLLANMQEQQIKMATDLAIIKDREERK